MNCLAGNNPSDCLCDGIQCNIHCNQYITDEFYNEILITSKEQGQEQEIEQCPYCGNEMLSYLPHLTYTDSQTGDTMCLYGISINE